MDLFKDWFYSINRKSENLINKHPHEEKNYPEFMINRGYSMAYNTVFFANHLNINWKYPTNKMKYDFLYYGLPPQTSYAKWKKNQKDKDYTDIDFIKWYYKVNDKRAIEYIDILPSDKIEDMKIRSNYEERLENDDI